MAPTNNIERPVVSRASEKIETLKETRTVISQDEKPRTSRPHILTRRYERAARRSAH